MERRRESTYYSGDSYRPAYESRRASPPRRPSPPPNTRAAYREDGIPTGPRWDRTDQPTRSASYAGSVQYYPGKIAQIDGTSRSSNTTPAESPRSPITSNISETTVTASRALDPRRKPSAHVEIPSRSGARGRQTAREVAIALTNSTNERLQQSPGMLDFGAVKKAVEQNLGLTPDFWGKSEEDEWYMKSKNIIKQAVVSLHLTDL